MCAVFNETRGLDQLFPISDDDLKASDWNFEEWVRNWCGNLTVEDARRFNASNWDAVELPTVTGRCISFRRACVDLGKGHSVQFNASLYYVNGDLLDWDTIAKNTGECGEYGVTVAPAYECVDCALYKDGEVVDCCRFEEENPFIEGLSQALEDDEWRNRAQLCSLAETLRLAWSEDDPVLLLNRDLGVWLDFNELGYIHA